MIAVLNSGLFTSIQDLGRFGFRNQGVPVSGAMDSISAKMANSLLNNMMTDAVLEITLMGPKLLFKANTIIVIAGANMTPKINNETIPIYKPTEIFEGEILSFGKLVSGARCYLAIKNGINAETILNSKSQFSSITSCNRLMKSDQLKLFSNSDNKEVFKWANNNDKQFFDTEEIEVTPGPEYGLFSKNEIANLLTQKLTISNHNNRMGYQIVEEVICHSISMTTSPVLPGTVQLLPSGRLIILMRDAQTTGGYPRVLQLTEYSISILAQKKVGDKIYFKLKEP